MKYIISLLFVFIACIESDAQRLITRDAKINFSSEAPLEKIEAENNTVSSVLDLETGDLVFAVLIRAFRFEKSLMEEHFNENYMESEKFPKATFKGTIANFDQSKFTKEGNFDSVVNGSLTMHGETVQFSTPVNFEVTSEKITGKCAMHVLCSDYKIEIPKIVSDNISNEVNLEILAAYPITK